jgi:hypothetical protein
MQLCTGMTALAATQAMTARRTHHRDHGPTLPQASRNRIHGRRFRNDTERLEKLFELYTKMTARRENGQSRATKKGRTRKGGCLTAHWRAATAVAGRSRF